MACGGRRRRHGAHPAGAADARIFLRDTVTVARELLGTYLVRMQDGVPLVGRISETEAYIGRRDRACHAYGYRRTPRTETLFAPPGTVYIYLIYGMYHCLNLVTEAEGEPAAVLIRAVQPRHNFDILSENRFGRKWQQLTRAQNPICATGPESCAGPWPLPGRRTAFPSPESCSSSPPCPLWACPPGRG